MEKLSALTAKRSSSYSAFRANTAIAEIYFQRKSYEEALKYYELAALAVKNSYAAGVAYFNAASCADESGNNEKALEFYEKAATIENFPLIPRALFNAGRIYEAMSKKDEAVSRYNKLLESYPKNEWALLAKSRIIDISKDNL
ncbi:tetratricopeptide repeat protein [Treponema pedis]|uniref:tetratricopeptide repeat protein n=1 Tax=Treponema pedis TaxID=409322 RepID=UPI0020900734|nr:tetratricopeptide repeat protein [Treponema pedis]